MAWRAAKNMKPAPISWGHQKAVNWLDIEQQLFYNNCPPYLHPVPVPGVYNGSMYPKCLYPDEPVATQFKGPFFPSAALAQKREFVPPSKRDYKKSNHLFPILLECWSTERTAQVPVAGGRPHHSLFPFCRSFWSCRVTFQTAFQELPAGMPMQRSHALRRDICALTYIHKASELTAGKVLPKQQDK